MTGGSDNSTGYLKAGALDHLATGEPGACVTTCNVFPCLLEPLIEMAYLVRESKVKEGSLAERLRVPFCLRNKVNKVTLASHYH